MTSIKDTTGRSSPYEQGLLPVETPESLSASASAPPLIVSVLIPLATGNVFRPEQTGIYDYLVPPDMGVQAGDFVRVPFGARHLSAVAWENPHIRTPQDRPQKKLKYISERHDVPPLSQQMRDFIDWVAGYVLAAPGHVLRQLMRVPDAFEPPVPIKTWRDAGKRPPRMTPMREKIYTALADGAALSIAELAERAGVSQAVVRGLIKAGGLEQTKRAMADDFPMPDPQAQKRVFSAEQQKAVVQLRTAMQAGAFKTLLLDGVTGSGKTEVYFEAVAEAIRQQRPALILLPEISLTVQFLHRFTARFGCPPAVWHSGLSATKRRRTWRAVAEGRVPVLVGARSALFLPWPDVGVIIIDEEHDAGHKQEDGLIYNARDMAIVRARMANALAILSSATPALETFTNARSGRYLSLHLPQRHGRARLPDMQLIDMRLAPPPSGRWLAAPLVEAISATLEQGAQAMLYLNRRGYAPLMLCRACGHRFACTQCDSWLVAHERHQQLRCHHCAASRPMPVNCDSCGESGKLAACGPGVERIGEEISRLFPDKKISVLSSDFATGTARLRDMLARISQGDIDIIIGTQIIAKGHHFPRLDCVGVVDADLGLGNGDLRAGERTYQLLSQVAGRAGRESFTGRALLQSYMPDHPVLQALISGDRNAFLRREAAMRQQAGMPPFGRLAALILSGTELAAVNRLAQTMLQAAPPQRHIRLLGPAPAPLFRLRNHYRVRFLLKGAKHISLQDYIRQWLAPINLPRQVRLAIDIDPYSFF